MKLHLWIRLLFSSSGLRSVLRGFPPDEDDFWDGFDAVAGEAAVVAVAVTVAVVDGADEVDKPADINGATVGAGAEENEMYLKVKRNRKIRIIFLGGEGG